MSIAKSIVWSGLSAVVGAERALSTAERAVREFTLFKRRARQVRNILAGAYVFSMRWDRPGHVEEVTDAHGEKRNVAFMGGWEVELSSTFDRGDNVSHYLVEDDTLRHALLALGKQMLDNTVPEPLPESKVDLTSASLAYGPPYALLGCDYHGVPTPGCGKCAAKNAADAAAGRAVELDLDEPVVVGPGKVMSTLS